MQAQTHQDNESAWEETISAWVDGNGEVRPEDLDTPYGRQVWDTYHLIGDVMRSKDLAVQPSDLFYARVSRAIDQEPAIVAPRRKVSTRAAGVSGLAVAAAVALVAWVLVPVFTAGPDTGIGASAPVMASADEPALVDYVDAHRQFAGVNPVRQVSWHGGVAGR
ncbi:MAG: sigma-E factor negative regulatory protein [Pusillimonas sp.]